MKKDWETFKIKEKKCADNARRKTSKPSTVLISFSALNTTRPFPPQGLCTYSSLPAMFFAQCLTRQNSFLFHASTKKTSKC